MANEIRLPPLGQTADEMSIVEWYKTVGDSIGIAEPLLCVETDKAQVDVESAEEGTILQILAKPGELLASGTLIAWVGEPGESVPVEVRSPDDGKSNGHQAKDGDTPAGSSDLNQPSPGAARGPLIAPPPGKLRVSPLVRKLAADLGVDLFAIVGSGTDGVIERSDVVNAAGPAAERNAASTEYEVPALRRAIARRLTKSVQTIPQFTLQVDLNAAAAKVEIADFGSRLTYTHLIIRAVARAMRQHPNLSRLWVEEGPKYRTIPDPNVGMAVAGDDSLFVVTIPSPDRVELGELVQTVSDAAMRGRLGTLSKQDLLPAAIAVSNLGMFGIDSFQAIIDPDQTAILAVGAVREVVVAEDGAIKIAPIIKVSLTCDHRSVDGAQAAMFLRTVKEAFESPVPTGSSPL